MAKGESPLQMSHGWRARGEMKKPREENGKKEAI
jgi:hypothetical protein